jgi:hypothetical protein
MDYSNTFRAVGGAIGCGVGSLGGPAGVLAGCSVGLILGTAGGALYGFLAGGFDTGGANAFEGAHDASSPFEYNGRRR